MKMIRCLKVESCLDNAHKESGIISNSFLGLEDGHIYIKNIEFLTTASEKDRWLACNMVRDAMKNSGLCNRDGKLCNVLTDSVHKQACIAIILVFLPFMSFVFENIHKNGLLDIKILNGFLVVLIGCVAASAVRAVIQRNSELTACLIKLLNNLKVVGSVGALFVEEEKKGLLQDVDLGSLVNNKKLVAL